MNFSGRQPWYQSLDWKLVDLLEAAPTSHRLPRVEESTIAQVQLTSGTGTEPRGVLLANGALMGRAKALAKALDIRGAEVILNPDPLFHISGQFFSLAALSCAA
jgi:acyl-CoA synthetase (AMP-forming)/AMP-acid ligase II